MTIVIGIRLNLVFQTDDQDAARNAAHQYGRLLAQGHDPVTGTVCLVDDGTPQVKRVVYVGHETGYRLVQSSVPVKGSTDAQ